MARPALYRVYRPRTFSDVAGQAHITTTLREAVRTERLGHAYVFSGPRGTGKTSMARILAKTINCSARLPNGDPCLACDGCRAVEQGQHLDVIEIDAASNRGIDEIREIKERLMHRPAMGPMKIYIVDEVHMLSEPAFNALLKTLEEPPPHVVFILATTELQKLPVTVLSRCQRYEFQRLSVETIQSRLQEVCGEEQVQADADALELIAEFADGALRDGLSLLDQALALGQGVRYDDIARLVGATDRQSGQQLLCAMADGDVAMVFDAIQAALKGGRDHRLLIRDIARQLHNLLIYRKAGPEYFASFRRQVLEQLDALLPKTINASQWYTAMEILAETEGRLRGGFPPDLSVELALFKVRDALQPPMDSVYQQPVAGTIADGIDGDDAKAQRRDQPARPPVPANQAAHTTPLPRARASAEAESSASTPDKHDPPATGVGEFLDAVRRERPSTFSLLQDAKLDVIGPDLLQITVRYPAHQNLLQDDLNHRDVVRRCVQTVFGQSCQVRVVVKNSLAGSGRERPSSANLKDEVREWFGEDIRLVGFDE